MRYHERGRVAVINDTLHLLLTFSAEVAVADGENFVEDYNIGLDHAGYGEGYAALHAARERAEGTVLKFAHLSKVDDLVVF